MPEKEKLSRQIPLRMTESLADEFEGVARANHTDIQDLLRRAARAIVRAHHEHGEVPMDMELVQRAVGRSANAGGAWALNEAQASAEEALRRKSLEPVAPRASHAKRR